MGSRHCRRPGRSPVKKKMERKRKGREKTTGVWPVRRWGREKALVGKTQNGENVGKTAHGVGAARLEKCSQKKSGGWEGKNRQRGEEKGKK